MNRLTLFVSMVVVLGIGEVSMAANDFVGSSSAVFGTPTPANAVYSGVGTNRFTSGQPFYSGTDPNILTIDGVTFGADAGSVFKVADFSYFNSVTLEGSDVASVPVTFDIDFTTPSLFSEMFTFSFLLDITPNDFGDLPDTLTPVNVESQTSFTTDLGEFTLKLLGFSSDGGQTLRNDFLLPERETAFAGLYAELSAPSQPDPPVDPPADPEPPADPGPGNPVPTPTALLAGSLMLASLSLRRRRG